MSAEAHRSSTFLSFALARVLAVVLLEEGFEISQQSVSAVAFVCYHYSTIVVARSSHEMAHLQTDGTMTSSVLCAIRVLRKATENGLFCFLTDRSKQPVFLVVLVENRRRNNSCLHPDPYELPNNHFSTHQKWQPWRNMTSYLTIWKQMNSGFEWRKISSSKLISARFFHLQLTNHEKQLYESLLHVKSYFCICFTREYCLPSILRCDVTVRHWNVIIWYLWVEIFQPFQMDSYCIISCVFWLFNWTYNALHPQKHTGDVKLSDIPCFSQRLSSVQNSAMEVVVKRKLMKMENV